MKNITVARGRYARLAAARYICTFLCCLKPYFRLQHYVVVEKKQSKIILEASMVVRCVFKSSRRDEEKINWCVCVTEGIPSLTFLRLEKLD